MGKLRHPRKVPSLVVHGAVPMLAAVFALGLAAACGGGGGGNTGGGSTIGTGGQASGSGGQASGSGGHSTGSDTSSVSVTGSSSSGTGGVGPMACTGDTDCTGNPKGAFCDTASGNCVACVPSNDTCGAGTFCDPTAFTCTAGCKADADCVGDPGGATHCSPSLHQCVNCLGDADCPAGQLCLASSNICIPGCSPTHDCPSGQTCCGSSCYDLTSDFNHCGACDKGCENPSNGTGQCLNGMCAIKQCLPAFADCNGMMDDGCEWNKLQDGPCTCTPGATQACYQGSPGTQGVGPCKAGVQTCDATGTAWGPCIGQILPVFEICANGVDDDCDGTVDNVPDQDGDGWTICNGDCCDVAGPGCSNPKLVNPGAFEVAGDGIDNDCDGVIDNPVTTVCSTVVKFSGVTGLDVAKAMDLCQTTTANPTPQQKKWGVISATQVFANGVTPSAAESTNFQNKQTAISNLFGNTVTPRKNQTFAIISSGMARDANDSGWVTPITGSDFTTVGSNTSIAFPGTGALGTYTNAHGAALLPGKCGSSNCPVGTGANDSINIRLQIRVPTNAQGFSYDFRFYSAEYQSFQCTQYNDYYLASLTSLVPGIPADHNISFDSLGNAVSVNNGFFQDCGGNSKACGTCPFGTASLAGTGFDQVSGGSTEWLTTDSPIVPGETMILELMVFDVQDHIYDTLILLDNFRWSLTPVTLGTHT
ncbi:MAG: MopE-related protein [Minicystis sp.]